MTEEYDKNKEDIAVKNKIIKNIMLCNMLMSYLSERISEWNSTQKK